MSGRGTRTLCRLVVAAWLCALAVGSAGSDAETPIPVPESPRARLQAVAEAPAPAPSAAPTPRADPPAPPEPAPAPPATAAAPVGAADRARGADLLSGSGRFPVLSASYQGMQSFRSYAAAMASLGARFVVVSRSRIVAEVDPTTGTIREAAIGAGFSPRARDYSDEPALAEPARRVRERFGADAEVMLLVPRALDAGLFGGIARELARQDGGHEAFREIEGRYEPGPAGGLRFRLVSGVRMDGRRVPLRSVFDLDALTRGSRG